MTHTALQAQERNIIQHNTTQHNTLHIAPHHTEHDRGHASHHIPQTADSTNMKAEC